MEKAWKLKTVRSTMGNQSRLGCILIAVLGQMPKHPPRIRGGAIITSDGLVIADMELRNGKGFLATPLGDITEIRDNFRCLADHLKLGDDERRELFIELQKWIVKDYRATSTLQ